MATTNVTELRKNLFSTIDSVIKFNEPVQVVTKNGNAVLLSEEDYNLSRIEVAKSTKTDTIYNYFENFKRFVLWIIFLYI